MNIVLLPISYHYSRSERSSALTVVNQRGLLSCVVVKPLHERAVVPGVWRKNKVSKDVDCGT